MIESTLWKSRVQRIVFEKRIFGRAMPGSPSNRGARAFGAIVVVLLHVALVWFLTHTVIGMSAIRAEPAPIAVVELPALSNDDVGPAPIEASLSVPRLQVDPPLVPDIPTEEPQLPTPVAPAPPPALAPTLQTANPGLNGKSEDSAGESGGGKSRALLSRVAPEYPLDARRRGEEGATQALLRVDESGQVLEVKIVSSSGSRRLDNAAVSAFRKWKFASVSKGSAPEGSWIQTSHRFLLTYVKYSRLEDPAAEDIHVTERAADTAPSGSSQALRRFLQAVADNRVTDTSDRGRFALSKMRAALSKWGVVKSVDFVSTAGPADWTEYQVAEDAAAGVAHVDCKWAVLEVRHENVKTVWLIALDHDGTIWSARAGPAS